MSDTLYSIRIHKYLFQVRHFLVFESKNSVIIQSVLIFCNNSSSIDNNAKEVKLLLPKEFLRYVLTNFKMEKDLSPDALLTGIVKNMWIAV